MSRPFDEARYVGLLEGLEITVIKRSEAFVENPGDRLDSEFFLKETLRTFRLIKKISNDPVSNLVAKVQHPRELERNYEDSGLHVVLAQNVRNNFFEFAEQAYMSEKARAVLATNLVAADDILMTRSGANYGQTAAWMRQDGEAFACADLLIFRKPKCPSGYLSTFFATSHGKRLIDRGAYGMAQPHIAPSYLEIVRVPRFSELEKQIDSFVRKSVAKFSESDGHMSQAEQTLLRALGLQDWQPPEPLTYTRRASEAFTAGRLDADFFAPKYEEMITRMGAGGTCVYLDSLLDVNRRGKQPEYAESGLPVVNSKHVLKNEVRLNSDNAMAVTSEEALKIKNGDVLMNGTGVGTIGRAAAYLHDGLALPDNHVTILRPRPGAIDPIYLSVYLNTIAGQWQVEKYLRGSSGQIELYPVDIAQFKVCLASAPIQQEVRGLVIAAFSARRQAHALLEATKRAVEIAIEQGEAEALIFLKENGV